MNNSPNHLSTNMEKSILERKLLEKSVDMGVSSTNECPQTKPPSSSNLNDQFSTLDSVTVKDLGIKLHPSMPLKYRLRNKIKFIYASALRQASLKSGLPLTIMDLDHDHKGSETMIGAIMMVVDKQLEFLTETLDPTRPTERGDLATIISNSFKTANNLFRHHGSSSLLPKLKTDFFGLCRNIDITLVLELSMIAHYTYCTNDYTKMHQYAEKCKDFITKNFFDLFGGIVRLESSFDITSVRENADFLMRCAIEASCYDLHLRTWSLSQEDAKRIGKKFATPDLKESARENPGNSTQTSDRYQRVSSDSTSSN